MVQETENNSRQAINLLFCEKMGKSRKSQLEALNHVPCKDSKEKTQFDLSNEHLVEKLREILKQLIAPKVDNSISAQRDKAISTIRCLTHFYNCNPSTYATAVSCMDRFLAKVKVQSKYYSCLATACFYLSSKFHEENEDVPSATELSSLMQHAWKSSDLKRMETVVMQKLDWKLWVETCPSLLKTLCDIICTTTKVLDHQFLSRLVQKFEICINYSSCAIYSTACLALSLLQHGLQEKGLLNNAMNQSLFNLHNICQISDAEFYECHHAVSQVLDNYRNSPKSHPSCLPMPKPFLRPNLVSRPSLYGDSELPAIEEDPSVDLLVSKTESEYEEISVSSQKFVFGGHSWSTCILPQKCATCSLE
ncbi:cyclin-G1-like [Saccostrea echinata]|uniref:cyclin-G1-like n=1 Tax=Saccostrea echinata TaxID=191078 RepID=UPI002A801F81|nr:cyclin-G1-like [Saccostrea echinata]XP_061184531.1 cyclin-G1-like [Saccostrea echinata]